MIQNTEQLVFVLITNLFKALRKPDDVPVMSPKTCFTTKKSVPLAETDFSLRTFFVIKLYKDTIYHRNAHKRLEQVQSLHD